MSAYEIVTEKQKARAGARLTPAPRFWRYLGAEPAGRMLRVEHLPRRNRHKRPSAHCDRRAD